MKNIQPHRICQRQRNLFTAFILILSLFVGLASAQEETIVREDFTVESDPGVNLSIRVVRNENQATGVPLLLLHGARVPGVPSFDLEVPSGSLAADLARAGHTAYIVDLRGYGSSSRPPEMSAAADANPPLVRSPVAARDIDAAVEAIRERENVEQIAALGWATGGQWLGYYATLYPEKLSHLVMYNSLYGGVATHPNIGRGSNFETPDAPGAFNTAEYGAYRYSTAESLFPSWDNSIPLEDKSEWRDPVVAEAYADAAIASDPTSSTRTPPSFAAPSGALEDSFYLATGRQLWDASLLHTPVLYIRSENDFWSRSEDAERLAEHAERVPVEIVTIPDATHFVHLDRPERGRERLIQEVLSFLRTSP